MSLGRFSLAGKPVGSLETSGGVEVRPDVAESTMEGFDPVEGASIFPDTAETVMQVFDPALRASYIRRVALPGLYIKSVIL